MLFQSSKLKARTSLFTETWQKRPSSFELWAFESDTPSGIGCTSKVQGLRSQSPHDIRNMWQMCSYKQFSSARRLLPADMLERWPHVCRVKITFPLLLTNRFVSTTTNSIKCLVNWIPLRICVLSRNTKPHLKSDKTSPHEKLPGITWVSNPATRKYLAARTCGVFWYQSKITVLFEIMVQIKQKSSIWQDQSCKGVGAFI